LHWLYLCVQRVVESKRGSFHPSVHRFIRHRVENSWDLSVITATHAEDSVFRRQQGGSMRDVPMNSFGLKNGGSRDRGDYGKREHLSQGGDIESQYTRSKRNRYPSSSAPEISLSSFVIVRSRGRICVDVM